MHTWLVQVFFVLIVPNLTYCFGFFLFFYLIYSEYHLSEVSCNLVSHWVPCVMPESSFLKEVFKTTLSWNQCDIWLVRWNPEQWQFWLVSWNAEQCGLHLKMIFPCGPVIIDVLLLVISIRISISMRKHLVQTSGHVVDNVLATYQIHLGTKISFLRLIWGWFYIFL